MQKDVVTVDLGYITNGGLSLKLRQYNDTLDDTFAIQFLLHKSDHWENPNDGTASTHTIRCAVTFGDVIVVGKTIFTILEC